MSSSDGRNFPPSARIPIFLPWGRIPFTGFLCSRLKRWQAVSALAAEAGQLARLEVGSSWEQVLRGKAKSQLEDLLPAYLRGKRWFGGKAQQIKKAAIQEFVPLQDDAFSAFIAFAAIDYMDGNSETYVLPLAFAIRAAGRGGAA